MPKPVTPSSLPSPLAGTRAAPGRSQLGAAAERTASAAAAALDPGASATFAPKPLRKKVIQIDNTTRAAATARDAARTTTAGAARAFQKTYALRVASDDESIEDAVSGSEADNEAEESTVSTTSVRPSRSPSPAPSTPRARSRNGSPSPAHFHLSKDVLASLPDSPPPSDLSDTDVITADEIAMRIVPSANSSWKYEQILQWRGEDYRLTIDNLPEDAQKKNNILEQFFKTFIQQLEKDTTNSIPAGAVFDIVFMEDNCSIIHGGQTIPLTNYSNYDYSTAAGNLWQMIYGKKDLSTTAESSAPASEDSTLPHHARVAMRPADFSAPIPDSNAHTSKPIHTKKGLQGAATRIKTSTDLGKVRIGEEFVLTIDNVSETFTIMNTKGDGACGIHAMLGTPNASRTIQCGDTAQARNEYSKILDAATSNSPTRELITNYLTDQLLFFLKHPNQAADQGGMDPMRMFEGTTTGDYIDKLDLHNTPNELHHHLKTFHALKNDYINNNISNDNLEQFRAACHGIMSGDQALADYRELSSKEYYLSPAELTIMAEHINKRLILLAASTTPNPRVYTPSRWTEDGQSIVILHNEKDNSNMTRRHFVICLPKASD